MIKNVLFPESDMAVCQNLVPLVNIKIAGKWMFIPLKMVLIGIDPYPYQQRCFSMVNPSSTRQTISFPVGEWTKFLPLIVKY